MIRRATPAWLDRKTRSLLLMALLATFLFGLSLWQNTSHITQTSYHQDESRWLYRAWYLGELENPTSDRWADSWLRRAQPPMGSYATGLGLGLQGLDLDTNGPWAGSLDVNGNVIRGNMPNQQDLEAGRTTNAVLAALTTLAIFALVTALTNIAGGVVVALLITFHPLHTYSGSIVLADAAFALFIVLSALAAFWLAMKPGWPRTFLLAMPLAAGASTKLSPLLVAVALAGLGVILLIDRRLHGIRYGGKPWSNFSARNPGHTRKLGIMLIVQPVLTWALFVLLYPFLWPSPVLRTYQLFDNRREAMQRQMGNSAREIETRTEAIRRTWTMVFGNSSLGQLKQWSGDLLGFQWNANGYEAFLGVAGFFVLLFLCWRRGLSSPTTLATMVIATQAISIIGGMSVTYYRYFIPFALFAALCSGVLAGALWQIGTDQLRQRTGKQEHAPASSVQPDAMRAASV